MTGRHQYTSEELEEYFDRICFPKDRRIHNVSELPDNAKLDFLHLLQKHQLVKVPWENLTQHYSWHRVVNVKPKHLFRKIVHSPGRGGYCFEANYFFHVILYSLGFDTYMCGSRIYSPEKQSFGGFTHVVNIVTIAETRYLLDGGYGGSGPTKPVVLEHDVPQTQIAPAQMRLLYEPIPQNLNQKQKVWLYQSRYNEDSDWTTHYCWVDTEFIPADIQGLNMEPWLNPHTFFAHKIVAVRFSTAGERNGSQGPGSPPESAMQGEIDGSVTINHDILKWRRNGKKVAEVPFKTEDDRLQALEMYFGITISEEDREGIAGTAAQLGAASFSVD